MTQKYNFSEILFDEIDDLNMKDVELHIYVFVCLILSTIQYHHQFNKINEQA